MIYRKIEKQITERLQHSNKIVVVYGARQVGKTTLIKTILKNNFESVLEINADEKNIRMFYQVPI